MLVCLTACVPKNSPTSKCHEEFLGVADPWSCTVSAETVDAVSYLSFTTESRNKVAQVKLSLFVAKGTLKLGYVDVAGEQHAVVAEGAPLTLEMQAPMQPQRRSFSLSFEPQGKVEGLTGTVSYSTP